MFRFKKYIIRLFIGFILIHSFLISANKQIDSFIYDDIYYFSISEFCDSQEYKYIYYEDKAKVAILFNDSKMTFSANSSFVQVNEQTVHLLNHVIIKDDIFYLPVNSFNILSDYYSTPTIFYNKENNNFSIIPFTEPKTTINTVKTDTVVYDDIYLNNQKNHQKWSINTIVLDAGHGGKDPGAVGYYNIHEKNIVLDITNELGRYIEKNHPNIKVIYTRTDDTFLGLRDRTNIANENKGQIFISVHANASTAKSARGFEIFLLGPNSVDEAMEVTLRENASIAFEDNQEQYKLENQIIASLSQTTFLKESEKLALFIENNVKKELPKTRMRGIKQAGFHVLVGASMPNLLVEVGFISNKSEAKLLNKSSYRRQMARGIFNGISDYIEYYEKKYN
jgi:N-acetylmuramoyl-L-alanine amidase|tara:strand:+ start:639 stop:1820 length:1182 start_codon:yes stop_codon:yes gene_type:complete